MPLGSLCSLRCHIRLCAHHCTALAQSGFGPSHQGFSCASTHNSYLPLSRSSGLWPPPSGLLRELFAFFFCWLVQRLSHPPFRLDALPLKSLSHHFLFFHHCLHYFWFLYVFLFSHHEHDSLHWSTVTGVSPSLAHQWEGTTPPQTP